MCKYVPVRPFGLTITCHVDLCVDAMLCKCGIVNAISARLIQMIMRKLFSMNVQSFL